MSKTKLDLVTISQEKNCTARQITGLKEYDYTYPIFLIQLAIQQRLECYMSWRSIEKNFKLWGQFFNLPTPDHTTIRLWFLKLAIFELQSPKDKRDDWIFIIDTIIGVGQKKCFLILGLSYQKWCEKLDNNDRITHDDVQVLAMEILDSTKGEILAEKINNLAERVGQPIQIISDLGSDIRKGISLYTIANPRTIFTYDFTHQVALWLKHKLSNQHKVQEFLDLCSLTRPQVQQTELAFLMPTKGRYKARYHNIDLLVSWGLSVLKYWRKQDFSAISKLFIINSQTIEILKNVISIQSVDKLFEVRGFSTFDLTYFYRFIIARLDNNEDIDAIVNAANFGKRRFLEKLGWLLDYQSELKILWEILNLYNLGKTHLNRSGLHQNSLREWLDFSQNSSQEPRAIAAKEQVSQYLTTFSKPIDDRLRLPATSDIIESLFGKYKAFAKGAPYSEINETVLSLVLSTTKITTDRIIQALKNIKNTDVVNWLRSSFGESILSKRKRAFSSI